MNTPHTPGPWVFNGDCDPIMIQKAGPDGTVKTIACLDYDDYPASVDTQVANGCLIAAAPDLLNSLRALVDWARQHTSPVQPNSPHQLLVDAWKALDRAEGRTE